MTAHLTHLLDQAFNQTPDNAAFSGLNHTMHYDTLYHSSLKVSHYLSNNTKTGTVAIILPNLLAFPVVLFGAWYADKTVTLINPLYTSDELLKQCLDAQVSSIIIAKIFAKTLVEIIDQTQIKTVITVEVGDFQSKLKGYIINTLSHLKYKTKVTSYKKNIIHANLSAILAQPRQNSAPNTFNNDIALLQYTGGTSGIFKAAVLEHRNLLANIHQLEQWLPKTINGNSTILTALPLYHIFALTINCLLFIRIKANSILVLNPREQKQLIAPFKKYKINVITGVNTLFVALMNYKNFEQLNTSNLKVSISGGMPLNKKLANKWQFIVGRPIVQGYGLTECSPVVSAESYDIGEFSGSVGKPLTGTKIKILDTNQQALGVGEIGEIAIKGPQVMEGYWKGEKYKYDIFTEDNYFISGDIGYLDEDGKIFIVGRAKDVIIVSGFNVYPDDVEQVLNQHPDVIESACIGIKDNVSGQSIKAFVVKKPKATLTKQTLIDHCETHLTHYKIPKTIEWIDKLPKSNIGKILKRKLVS